MKESPKKLMALSQRPSGQVLVTQANLTREIAGDDPTIWRCCLDASATEIVPQTEAAFADFLSRHNGRGMYPTLAAYPAARG